jgi:hypothetical protein
MAVAHPCPHKAFPCFKRTVFGLLGLDVILSLTEQTRVEGSDSLAWLDLLLLVEWETGRLDKPYVSVGIVPALQRLAVAGIEDTDAASSGESLLLPQGGLHHLDNRDLAARFRGLGRFPMPGG